MSLRRISVIMGLAAVIGFLPALAMAYFATLWIGDLHGFARLSAAAWLALPIPLALTAAFAGHAARTESRSSLRRAAIGAAVAAAFILLGCAWGGRMLA